MPEFEDAILHGDVETLARLLEGTPQQGRALEVILGENFFRTWDEFEVCRHAESDSSIGRFETAADAVIEGNAATLRELIAQDSTLATQARSTRTHRAMLLHYCAANGVENFRQRTPANAVEIARILLDAGAPVDGTASMYSDDQDTTLGLTVTSIHPFRAGVLEPLTDLLLDRGARIRDGMVRACHANGRAAGARLLAERGATLDLEAAAGLGRVDIVRSQWHRSSAEMIRDGFAWACEYGHAETVAFFLEQGFDVTTPLRNNGQTGLHWAAAGGHAAIVRMLLDRASPVNAKDPSFQATPLSWAHWGLQNGSAPAGIYESIRMLVRAGAEVKPEWIAQADALLAAALSGK